MYLQDKIAARKARREAEARRLADEAAARSILEEQSKSVVTKQELTSENIIIPDVPLPTESTEEKVDALHHALLKSSYIHTCLLYTFFTIFCREVVCCDAFILSAI